MTQDKDANKNEDINDIDESTDESTDKTVDESTDESTDETVDESTGKSKEKSRRDSLFENGLSGEEGLGGSMTFLEHLGELRERLIRALVSFAVCVVICFTFSDTILNILVKPLPTDKKAQAEEIAHFWNLSFWNPSSTASPGSATDTIHSATGNIIAAATPVDQDNEKLAASTEIEPKRRMNVQLSALSPFEGVLAYVKISLIAGIFLAFPFLFYEAWMFIAPGLYKREKKIVFPLIISAWFCFILGGCFCYFIIYSFILQFLVLFTPESVQTIWSLSSYISTTTRFMLAFGLIFEEPVVFTLLAKIGIVTASGLSKFRPYAIVIMFSLSALITPPDPISQITCALPMYMLYEISILIVRVIERGRKTESGEAYSG